MFSGIVEACVKVIKTEKTDANLLRIWVERPSEFDDIHLGDSIANNGVCLTVEAFDKDQIQFAIAHETLEVTSWTEDFLKAKPINLERSLRFGDRIHGHLVSGHVECMGTILKSYEEAGSYFIQISLPEQMRAYVWKKASVCINGISLTVNSVDSEKFEVCLIPETVERTNLASLSCGDKVCLEPDYMAKALRHWKDMDNALNS
jgi:riboflavin synthase